MPLMRHRLSTTLTHKHLGAAWAAAFLLHLPGAWAADPLDGVLVNQTTTVAGHDFFQYFSFTWREQPNSERFAVAVSERPTARNGCRILIDFGQQRLLDLPLPATNQLDLKQQSGSNLKATMSQDGNFNKAIAVQTGQGNLIDVSQTSNAVDQLHANIAYVIQSGSGQVALIAQHGNSNRASVWQH
jgi:hypothetical protein